MRWLARLSLGAVLALAVLGSAAAANVDGKSPSTALPLSSVATTTLTGNNAGSFTYYTFNYPGDGSVATIGMNFAPNDPSTASGVGVTVWQNGQQVAATNGVGSTPGAVSTFFSSTTAGPVLVQVYNYVPGEPVQLQVNVSGLATAAPTPQPAPSTAPPAPVAKVSSSSSSATSLEKALTTTLPGSSGGSYQYFTENYPGDGSQHTLNLSFSPPGADAGAGLFVNVYQDGNLLATGQGTDGSYAGVMSVSYSSLTAGPVLIQVANYNPDTTISYTINP